ncbi:MAG: trimeric intracellular cation channel family protein [Clostridia bacterium]|nr:trimeric intracellular cation channel family protein [Clostridia bacterium]
MMLFIDILDIIGTSAFAISGALTGIKYRFDLFGILMLAIFTASGGGFIRDVIISKELPVFFTNPRYFLIILVSTILTCFALPFLNKLISLIKLFDAAGLGVFTVLSAYKCILLDVPVIGVIFISLITGIGGGIIRDIMVNDIPLIFRREIYALAAISGTLCFYILFKWIDVNINLYISILLVFLIRIVSIYFNWNLPTIKSVMKTDRSEEKNGD